MEKSGEAIKDRKLKERTRKIVATAMQTARIRKELEQQLKKQGIDVVFRQNDSGRIYGVTFIDHDSRVVLNGSRLGKEYSANVFNERFSGETGKMHQPEVSAPQQDQSTHQEQPGFTPKSDIVPEVASVLGAFGGFCADSVLVASNFPNNSVGSSIFSEGRSSIGIKSSSQRWIRYCFPRR